VIDGPRQGGLQLGRVEGFEQAVHGAEPVRLDDVSGTGPAGHEDDRDLRLQRADLANELQAVHPGHHEVDEGHVEGRDEQAPQRGRGVGVHLERAAERLEHAPEAAPHHRIVVDDDDPHFMCRPGPHG
jgi:hypothetical protein